MVFWNRKTFFILFRISNLNIIIFINFSVIIIVIKYIVEILMNEGYVKTL